jgi:hypothetical protein
MSCAVLQTDNRQHHEAKAKSKVDKKLVGPGVLNAENN